MNSNIFNLFFGLIFLNFDKTHVQNLTVLQTNMPTSTPPRLLTLHVSEILMYFLLLVLANIFSTFQ
jgi:hypothetical protein